MKLLTAALNLNQKQTEAAVETMRKTNQVIRIIPSTPVGSLMK